MTFFPNCQNIHQKFEPYLVSENPHAILETINTKNAKEEPIAVLNLMLDIARAALKDQAVTPNVVTKAKLLALVNEAIKEVKTDSHQNSPVGAMLEVVIAARNAVLSQKVEYATSRFQFRKEHFEISEITNASTSSATSSSMPVTTGQPIDGTLFNFMPKAIVQEIADFIVKKNERDKFIQVVGKGDLPERLQERIQNFTNLLKENEGNIEELSDIERATYNDLANIGRYIYTLDITDCTETNWDTFHEVLERTQNVTVLNLSHTRMTFEKLEKLLPQLAQMHVRKLILGHAFTDDATKITKFAGQVTSVTTISLEGSRITDEQLTHLLTLFPRIHSLENTEQTRLTARFFDTLQNRQLKSVEIPSSIRLGDGVDFKRFLKQQKKLRKIVIKNNALSERSCKALKNCTKLTKIVLEACTFGPHVAKSSLLPNMEFLAEACNKMPKLSSLDFSDTQINDTSIIYLLHYGVRPLDLRLSNCPISDVGLVTITHQIPEIQKLDLSGTRIKEQDLREFLPELKQLTYLNLVNLPITDAIIETLCNLPHLTKLAISRTTSRDISDAGLQKLTSRCPQLKIEQHPKIG